MNNDLIFDDDYVLTLASRIEVRSRKMNEIMTEYKNILQTIHDEAITDGKIAKSLEEYISLIMGTLDMLKITGADIEKIIRGFQIEVNEADGEIY